MTAPVISPDHILRELAELWVATGKDGHAETGAGVLRACAMTLIVVAEESEDTAALGETLAALMPEHPARTILVRVREDAAPALAERVYAQCWMPFGQRQQICCEHVEIMASDASLADLPSVLLPLLAADLPAILWWRGARLFGGPAFRSLAELADKVIVDSTDMPDAKAALAALAQAGRGRLLGDLSWTVLTRWREMLSRLFENREYLTRLSEISQVRVAFAAPHEGTHAWYMGAWTVNALADAGVRAELILTPDTALSGRALRVELTGGDFRVALERHEDRLSIEAGGQTYRVNMPLPGDYIQMREELGIVRRDEVFERTLASAAALAAGKA